MTRRALPLTALALAALTACAAQPAVPPARRIVFDASSPSGRVLVVEEEGLRVLRFDSPDGDDQSALSLTDPRAVPFEYVQLAALAAVVPPRCERLLMIGLGGGSFSRLLRQLLPTLQVDIVEIDPIVVRVAREFFGVREDAHFRIHVGDGAAFLDSAGVYDLIFVDAYTGEGIPPHLATAEFFARVRAHLRPGGVAVANLALEPEQAAEVEASFATAFSAHGCLATPDGLNLVLLGAAADALPDVQALAAASGRLAFPFAAAPLARRLTPRCATR